MYIHIYLPVVKLIATKENKFYKDTQEDTRNLETFITVFLELTQPSKLAFSKALL